MSAEKEIVRICPLCESHPPYLPGALQCVECGAIRPRRMSAVNWHSCVKGATEPAQDALDCEFHSASRHGLSVIIDIECHFLGTYRVLNAQLSSVAGAAGAAADPKETDATALLVRIFAAHGLIVTA